MSKTVIGVIVALIILALIFVAVVLILGSVHGLSFTDEIQSWFSTAETVEPVIEDSVEAVMNMLKVN